MGRYIWIRLLKSLLSIAIVVSIVVVLVYKLVPTSKVFEGDEAFRKLKANAKVLYTYNRLETLGYCDYLTSGEMLAAELGEKAHSLKPSDEEYQRVLQVFRDRGYTIEELTYNDKLQGTHVAYRFYNSFELIGHFFAKLFQVDTPNAIQDPNWPEGLQRGYRFEKDHNGIYALTCAGCKHKYQLYFDKHFPFIHQNFIHIYFGESYPSQQGVNTLEVIGSSQGKKVKIEQTFPSGQVLKSPINQHSRKYKFTRDHLDEKKYGDDPYADTTNMQEAPSMIFTSYRIGLLSILFAYLFAIPMGIWMAKRKGKLIDKIGIIYINFILALPSLALIFFFKVIGYRFNLPDKFPQLGFHDIRSYILPVMLLAIMSTPGLMMWLRRYMVDQETSDYVKFARAKGLSNREIYNRHIFKNAVIPIVNGIPGSIILAISGAVITESMFAVPGMGKMLPDAIKAANNNMVITLSFIFTALSILSVFLGDLLMTVVDPRISLTVKEGLE
ncbi:MAG: ABC transporter permease [Eubacteriales bacterium]|nr:ABC transporter permease [Eubacteriales bacterium]